MRLLTTAVITLLFSLTLGSANLLAQKRILAEPPPISKKAHKRSKIKPAKKKEVKKKPAGFYEEYLLKDKSYMIKITPNKGKPYWLIDQKGDGNYKRSDLEPDSSPSQWHIKKF